MIGSVKLIINMENDKKGGKTHFKEVMENLFWKEGEERRGI
jgi:hypothetical protein